MKQPVLSVFIGLHLWPFSVSQKYRPGDIIHGEGKKHPPLGAPRRPAPIRASHMILHVLRALFVLLMGAVGYFLLLQPEEVFGQFTWLTMMITLAVGVFIVCVDILAPRRKLAVFSGTFLGLVVGLFIAYALSFVVTLVVDNYIPAISEDAGAWLSMTPKGSIVKNRDVIVRNVNLVMGVICCYLSISFILQTKDDFRFIIPYVEFQRQAKGNRPVALDTSALIDGRINDVVQTGI